MEWFQDAMPVIVTVSLFPRQSAPLWQQILELVLIDGFVRLVWSGWKPTEPQFRTALFVVSVVLLIALSIENFTPFAMAADQWLLQAVISMLTRECAYFTNESFISMNSLVYFALVIRLFLLSCWISLRRRIASVLGHDSKEPKSTNFADLSQRSGTRKSRRASTLNSHWNIPASLPPKPADSSMISESTEKSGDASSTNSQENDPPFPQQTASTPFVCLLPTSLESLNQSATAPSVRALRTVTNITPVVTTSSTPITSSRRVSFSSIAETDATRNTSNLRPGYHSPTDPTDTRSETSTGNPSAEDLGGHTGSKQRAWLDLGY